jgi:5'-methylthioadenosine phosphorylase
MLEGGVAYVLGVVGGSGIYELNGLEDVETIEIDTPYGAPSSGIVRGRLGTTTLLFLPRHGRHHHVPPHQINYRANVCALKKLGATHLVSLSAVGSMREEIVPGQVVIVDQYIDLTKRRIQTFFEDGVVGHVGLADPVCPELAGALAQASKRAGAVVHERGTYVCIEGPQFSTRAESLLYRSWGVSVIGMTAMPEARLAREAELPYATMALATDYDCWHEVEEDVSVHNVLAVMRANADLAKRTVAALSTLLPPPEKSPAYRAAQAALLTAKDHIPQAVKSRLSWLFGS